ncbi:MAG: GNAT family N-acetyltransferase [Chloroflexota bacterium]
MPPPIQTDRLTLRPFAPDDVPAFVASIFHDDAVWNELSGGVVYDAEHEAEQLITGWQGDLHPPLAVVRSADAALMGYAALKPIAGAPDDTELTIALGSRYWHNGYATEAGRAMLRYGFHERRLERIYGLLHPYNARAKRLATRLDMTFKAVNRDFNYGKELAIYVLGRATYVSLYP